MKAARPVAAGLGIAVLTLAAAPVGALEFEPAITVGITHTDNVALAATDEQSETVYRAEPFFRLSHETTRITANADYRMQAFRYADLGQSEIFHQYDASIRAALVPDMLFLEAGGNRSQSILDPEGTIPRGNLPISGNRQDRDNYYVSPSFQYALGSAITARGEYRNAWVNYSESDTQGFIADAENRDAQFSLDNYRRGAGISWALRYNWQRSDYDEGIPWEYQQAAAELGFWISQSTRLFASGGQESAWDMPLDPALEDSFWEAGVAHRVGERINAEFAAGERSFGSSWRGNLEVTFRRGSTSLSYAETPTTESRNNFRNVRFDQIVNLDDFLSRPGSAQRFVLKRLQWRFDYELQRTGISFGAFRAERTDRTTADGAPLDDEEQQGFNARITYRLGAKTDLRFGGSWAKRDFRDGGESQLTQGSAAIAYRLGARTDVSLEYQYDEEDPDGTISARDYVANTITLLLTRTF